MNPDQLFPMLFFVIFVFVIGSFVVKFIKYGGFKAAIFNAPIERTAGEVTASGGQLTSLVVRVHSLGDGSADKAIGLEIVAKSFASYQMMPVTLSISEAKKLAALLESATARRS